MALLNDPERLFVSSEFVQLEVLPKAVYFRQDAEASFYRAYVAWVTEMVPVSQALVTHAVHGVETLLVDVLGWDKTHGRSRHRFSDGLGITPILLVRLDKWLDELVRQAPDLVAMLTETSGPAMRPATGLSPDVRRGQLSNTGHQGVSRQTLTPENVPRCVSPHEMTHCLGQIDRNGVERLLHGTRPLAVT